MKLKMLQSTGAVFKVTKLSGHDLRSIKLQFLKSDSRLFGPILSTPHLFILLLLLFFKLRA